MELPLKLINRGLHNALIDATNSLERQRIEVAVSVPKSASEKTPANSVTINFVAAPAKMEKAEEQVVKALTASVNYFNANSKKKVKLDGTKLSIDGSSSEDETQKAAAKIADKK